MFEFLFGLFTIAFSFFALFIFVKASSSIIAFCVCGIFIVIGVFLFIVGLRKIIIDYITSKKGEVCFACVSDILPTGKSINEVEIFKALFIVYIGSENKVMNIFEEIGADISCYPVGSFVKVKYHNGDINIIDSVLDSVVPISIKEKVLVNREMS